MSGTFAVKEDDSFVAPGKQVTFGLGEVIEGHISVVLSAVEDPDLHQTLVPGELKLELLRNGSVFLTSGQLTASVVNDNTSVWQVRLTSNIHTRNVHMGGFVSSFAEKYESAGLDVSLIMGHYDREMLSVYDQLATQFKICDNWHAAHPGPTWPNRFITVTGRLNQDQFGQFERDNPNLATFTPSEATTLFDILTANNITWRYYENGYSFIRLFTRYTFDTTNVRGFSRFEDDARAGDLPQVIFIDPDFIEFPPGADDQAPSNPIDGQIFVGTVVNALLGSPAWKDTLLLVTYDEHGGFYDHVEPPATPVKFEGEMDRYGLRVPTFMVSPYVEPGDVSSQFFDHASIQATIQRTFLGPMAPDLGPRVAHAADVGPLLTRQQPRLSIPPLMLPPPPDPIRRAARPRQLPFPSQDSEEFNDLLFLARMFTGMGPE